MPSPLAAMATCGAGRRLIAREIAVDGFDHDDLRVELQLKTDALGQLAVAKFRFLVERHPAIAARVVDDEFIGGGLDAQAEIPALQQRALVQQADQALDAPALFVELSCRARWCPPTGWRAK